MPNATLCAKAVIEMILGQIDGTKSLQNIQQQLIESDQLPKAYVISRERIDRCRTLESVETQVRNGETGIGKHCLREQ